MRELLEAPAQRLVSALHTPTPHPPPCHPSTECLHDLLEAAARWLRPGGRLVYFLPAAPGYYLEEELPVHPALQVGAGRGARGASWLPARGAGLQERGSARPSSRLSLHGCPPPRASPPPPRACSWWPTASRC